MAYTESEQDRRIQQSELSANIGAGSQPAHLDLFSGIGGFALAARWAGFRTIGFCEIDKYCQKVLAKNFGAVPNSENNGHKQFSDNPSQRKRKVGEGKCEGNDNLRSESCGYDQARIFGNIFDLNGRDFSDVTLITGGFPCQPFSVAGKRGGAADDRAIWPQMFRVISEARPAWVLGENVPGIIPMELDNVLSDLEGIGYTTRAFVIPACAVDARHRRDRVWIIRRNMANAQSERSGCVDGHEKYSEQDQFNGLSQQSRGKGCDVSNHEGERSQGVGKTWREGTDQYGSEVLSVRDGGDRAEWLPEPGMGRVVDGLPQKLDGGINDKVDGEKTISTKYFPEWEMLRAMWHDRELAKASPELRVRKMLYFLSAMSCDYGSASWNTEAEKDPGVFSLWKEISTSGFSQSPNLFLRLFEQIGANKCAQEVAQWITEPAIPRVAIGVKDRVKRLKGLGNAIVSQVAYEILREIRKLI